MSVYEEYGTDTAAEIEGVYHRFDGGFKLRIARAGGGNINYIKALASKAEEFRGMSRLEMLEAGVMAQVYTEAVVTEIEDPDGKFVTLDGKKIKVGSKEMTALLTDLPDLFQDIQGYASDRRYFAVLTDTAKK